MSVRKYLILLALCLPGALLAKLREITILGGEKIKAEFQGSMPLPAEKDGIRIEAAAFMVGGGNLIYAFGFTTKKGLKKVVVEDVTNKTATVLVEDSTPKLESGYWKGEATPLPLSKSGVPWVYAQGDTSMVFRFFVTLDGATEPVVLHQPAVFAGAVKKQLQQLAR